MGLRARLASLRRRADPPVPAGVRLLAAFAATHPEATFVEIGANDGHQHDFVGPHVRAGRWSGVMVEPVPYVFERLRSRYGDLPHVALENVAVSGEDGTLPFWSLREAAPDERAALPHWYDGLGSFSRETVLAHRPLIADVEERLVRLDVPVTTFASLCARHGIERLDLLVVDTEGHDFEILRHVDLERHAPRLVVFEHFHLSPADREACRQHLSGAGYELMEEGMDTFALRRGPRDALWRRWRRLRPVARAITFGDQRP